MTPMQIKKQRGVLLIRGAILDLYIPTISPTVLTLNFPPDIYAEMEIKNENLASKLLTDFYKANKIPQTIFHLIVIAPLFKKEFPLAPQVELESTINTYLDYIPFDNVFSKRIKTEKGVVVIAANGDLIQSIKNIFMTVSSSVESVTPLDGLTLFPNGGLSVLTPTSGNTILSNIQLIQTEAFSLTPQRSIGGFEATVEEEEEKPKSQLPLLLSVFFILLIILGVVYFNLLPPKP